jgi:hypothetical protein
MTDGESGEKSVYSVRSLVGGWAVFDRSDRRVSEWLRTQADAVAHAKELARRDGSAHIVVRDEQDRVASEFFCQREEREALDRDDSVASMAATRPTTARITSR